MLLSDYIPDPQALLLDLRLQSPLSHSTIHGEQHWRWVASIGLYLLAHEQRGDPVVVLLFALFHDACRENEWHDPSHGARGAAIIPQYNGRYVFLNPSQLQTLQEACVTHTEGTHTDNPTIGICWDADRLNLWRIRRHPLPRFLTTSTGQNPVTITWARTQLNQSTTWDMVFEEYRVLLASHIDNGA